MTVTGADKFGFKSKLEEALEHGVEIYCVAGLHYWRLDSFLSASCMPGSSSKSAAAEQFFIWRKGKR